LELQTKLLRVLQEGEFEPLGSTKSVRVDVRVVAATNRVLKEMVASGKFREDLYFRLHVFPIQIPPLRERGKDIELLAEALGKRSARRVGRRLDPGDEAQLRRVRGYDWPGNARNLKKVRERAIILSPVSRLKMERAMGGLAVEKVAALKTARPAYERVFT